MKKLIVLILLSLNGLMLFAQQTRISWNLGSLELAADCLSLFDLADYDPETDPEFTLSFLDFAFIDTEKKFGIFTSLLKGRDNLEGDITSMLPVEMDWFVADWKPFYLTVYGKAELGYSETAFDPYFEAGAQLLLLPDSGASTLYYSSRNLLFVGINSNYELLAGLKLDFGLLLLLAMMSNQKTGNSQ